MFHEKLKEIRMKSGKTQKDLAEYLSISPQSVSKWEKGESLPSMEYLPKIAKFLGCTPNAFFGITTDCTPKDELIAKLKEVQDQIHCVNEKIFSCEKEFQKEHILAEHLGGVREEWKTRRKEVEKELLALTEEREKLVKDFREIEMEIARVGRK